MDKMREEFEAWLDSAGYHIERAGGGYKYDSINIAWNAWKASRAALCVQMPRCCNEEQDSYRLNIIDSLDDAGVSYE